MWIFQGFSSTCNSQNEVVRKTAAQLLVPRRSLWSSKPEGRDGQKGKVTNTEIEEVSYESKPTDHNTKTIT